MFDGIKSALHSITNPSEPRLSILPERKSMSLNLTNYDALAAQMLARDGFPTLAAARIDGGPSFSAPVSVAAALSIPTVWACNAVVSGSVGILPVNMMQTTGKETNPATAHPMFSALRYAPSAELNAQDFFQILTSHVLMQGNGYAQIIRRSGTGTAVELYPILPENVQVDRERDGQRRIVYVVKEANQPNQTYTIDPSKPQSILHLKGKGWDGLKGYSVISFARQSLNIALAQERNIGEFYRNGGRVPYVLEDKSHFENQQETDAFRAAWEETYSQPHKVPILQDGMNYKQTGMSAADAQLVESRQFTVVELCRWFSVYPHQVGDLSRATFSNIESLAQQFVSSTLQDHLTRWSQSLHRCVLTPDEKQQGYHFTHDLSVLLRADTQTRMAGYATLLQNGVDSINEVRAAEGKNPIPGGDEHHVQVNMAPLAQAGQTQARVKVGTNED